MSRYLLVGNRVHELIVTLRRQRSLTGYPCCCFHIVMLNTQFVCTPTSHPEYKLKTAINRLGHVNIYRPCVLRWKLSHEFTIKYDFRNLKFKYDVRHRMHNKAILIIKDYTINSFWYILPFMLFENIIRKIYLRELNKKILMPQISYRIAFI